MCYAFECRANLSELYFTHRQDRYMMLSDCPELADFFDRLVSAVQRYSFHLRPDDTVQLADGVTSHPFAGIYLSLNTLLGWYLFTCDVMQFAFSALALLVGRQEEHTGL